MIIIKHLLREVIKEREKREKERERERERKKKEKEYIYIYKYSKLNIYKMGFFFLYITSPNAKN